MKNKYEGRDPHWLRSIELDNHQEISNWLSEIREKPSLFETYHPDHDMVRDSWNRAFYDISRRIQEENLWGLVRPDNFVQAIEPFIEAYHETYQNPVCRYSFETNIRNIVATAQNYQPELVDHLDSRIEHLTAVPDHPALLVKALNSAEGVGDSLTSQPHADLLYTVGLTTYDYQNTISRNVEGSKGTIYEGLLDLERLNACAELTQKSLSRFDGDDLKEVRSLANKVEYFANESLFISDLRKRKERKGFIDWLNNLSSACYEVFH